MKLGISSYCLDREISEKRATLPEVITWAAEQGAQCIELVPFAFRFDDAQNGKIDSSAVSLVRRTACDAGIELCNYSVLADFCKEGDAYEREISRVCHEVDIASELGLPRMRHDVCSFRRPLEQNTLRDFERMMPRMSEAAGRVSEHGKKRGVRTMLENHGFFANGCDRVERLLNSVTTGNYGLLLDTGNIICVDEDPSVAMAALAPRCEMVHLKDFYVRKRDPGDATQFNCAGSWFRSRGGRYLRGAILAQGDLDIPETLGILKRSGYDGNIVLEFEGLENAHYATSVGLNNARRIWAEL